jgi:hypothetical protein
VRLAILATIAFAETIIDDARGKRVRREQISQIILATLVAALEAAST